MTRLSGVYYFKQINQSINQSFEINLHIASYKT